MKRLTMKDENGCFLIDKTATVTWNSLIGENRYRGEAVDRFAAIEDILGDEYDLDRLRELAEADREGRCVVLPRLEPGQDDPGLPGVPGPPGNVVFCKDCGHLEYSDCYGECGRGYLGIVKPYDYCSRGMRRDKENNT